MKNGVVILPRNWVVILNWNQVLTLNWNWVVNITGICTHVLTKIKNDDGYRIPLSTLAIICFYKKIELSEFFKLIEKQYGSKINDDFVLKTNTKKDA